ncbi:c-type cytochrome [Gemmata sp. JC717]|uniref:DUF7133 domain-containing protein n=1 Tax=Gemmata algarum TaxID=2975278 RepID=UPI0021BB1115|nr:c-type cytochrome [Gemmata algarum]MDY3551321.1 c-type cytochrome [Gemmata algarum]
MVPALLLLTATAAPPAPVNELRLPPGFSAKRYADNPLAPDTYTMAIDDAGRVLIAGRGYVRALVDSDNDGVADRAVDLVGGLKDGPMGLLPEGDSLFVVADGGLKRYRGYNGTDRLQAPELLVALKTGGEHDAHAVRRGPDGWLYLLCGNNAGVKKGTATDARSPISEPTAGAVLRLSPDFKTVEIVADGFRNPYSFDFNLDGEPFTYDSDNERCSGLPWYEGCRFLHIVPGGNYGWRSPQLSQTWRKPPHFPDVVKPVADLGRGSPTGVACYRHTQFPDKYRGGFFLADWTFGRIHFVPLAAAGSTYEGKPEVFAEATGTSGFAPTALAVHPRTGELFVSIGGRGTRGGVYRITFDQGGTNPKPLPMARRTLDHSKDGDALWLRDAAPSPRRPDPPPDEPRRRREALELLLRHRDKLDRGEELIDAVKANLASHDPLVRAAAARAAVALTIPVGNVPDGKLPAPAQLAVALATAPRDPSGALKVAFGVLHDPQAAPADLLTALRIVHLAHGDLTAKDATGTVWEGYTFRDPVPKERAALLGVAIVKQSLREPALPRAVQLELTRALAALGPLDGRPPRGAAPETSDRTPQADDFHYLITLARADARAVRATADEIATVLLRLPSKITAQGVTLDRHWPLRFDELLRQLATRYPDLNRAVLEHKAFGQPEHAALVGPLKLPPKAAARKLLARAQADPKYAWTPRAVALLAELPRTEAGATLEVLWDRGGFEEAVLRVIARQPDACDVPKFLVGLKSLDAEIVRGSADALARSLDAEPSLVASGAVRALRRFPDPKTDARTRDALVTLLQKYSKEKFGPDEKAWAAWLVKAYPDEAKALNASDGFDAAAWGKRLAAVDWTKGDAARGRAAFTKATCAACHDGGGAVGPSLIGVTKRFGRNDLLTAILQPSKDIPPRYRAVRITTNDDKSFIGVPVYEATDGIILQTGADTSARIAGTDIASKKPVELSLMPAGLLDKLADTEIADLLAYLGTLK